MHGLDFIKDLAVILLVAGAVGWICQRMGLSVVVGFLAAGVFVGPKSPPVALVTNVERIETLGEIGLVFLMFAIGLKLSIRKMRRLGMGLMLAVVIGALIMFFLTRTLGVMLGFTHVQGLFLAGMLMVSSSAVISKTLHETGLNHERPGQLAMGIAVLEDVVAVVMLTVLTSVVRLGQASSAQVVETLIRLGAFVVLAGVLGLLIVPWLLKRMSIAADEELQTLGIAALLFGLAVVAQGAGYSPALGAFLLGTIVAETPHRHQVERIFEGMRDVFTAVFFVAIGMQIDVRELWAHAGLVVLVAAFTIVGRSLAVALGLTLIGSTPRDALRTGMTATAIGEFSFVIIQFGVLEAVVPSFFYPMAVGVSLLTTLMAPVLTRRAEAWTEALITRQPRWLTDWFNAYHEWLERLRTRSKRNLIWQLSRKRVAQVSVGMLFVTGVIVFSGQLFEMAGHWVGGGGLAAHRLDIVFWIVLVLVTLAPLVAIWRNLSAMALIYSEIATKGHPNAARLRPLVETGFKILWAVGLAGWLTAIIPSEGVARWLPLASVVVGAIVLLLLRRKLILWHSEMEVELLSVIETADSRMTGTSAPWLQQHGEWNLDIMDCTLPDLANCQGKSIAQLELRSKTGCTVVGIERQGFMIALPGPESVLYPRDKVLLLGTPEQVKEGKTLLGAVSVVAHADSMFEEVRMEALTAPTWSRAAGKTLGEISPSQKHGVQIAGVNRGGVRILNPGASETVRAGDELLTLGPPEALLEFKAWLKDREEGAVL